MDAQSVLEGAAPLADPGLAAIGRESVGRRGGVGRGGFMQILIVEDDAVAAASLEATLADAGHTILACVASAREALEAVARERVDLALLDINLDGKRDGVELARELMVVHGVPAVFLSGDHNKARGGGDVAIAYLRKPYTDQEVLAAVEVAQGIIESERKAAGEPGLELF